MTEPVFKLDFPQPRYKALQPQVRDEGEVSRGTKIADRFAKLAEVLRKGKELDIVPEKIAPIDTEITQELLFPEGEVGIRRPEADAKEFSEIEELLKGSYRHQLFKQAQAELIRFAEEGTSLLGLRGNVDIRETPQFKQRMKEAEKKFLRGDVSYKEALIAKLVPGITRDHATLVVAKLEWAVKNATIETQGDLVKIIREGRLHSELLFDASNELKYVDGLDEKEITIIDNIMDREILRMSPPAELLLESQKLIGKMYADASFAHATNAEAATKMLTDLKDNVWNNVQKVLGAQLSPSLKGRLNVPKEFKFGAVTAKKLQEAFGDDWKQKFGLWVLREGATIFAVRGLLPGGAKYSFTAPKNTRGFFGKIAVGALEGSTYMGLLTTEEAAFAEMMDRDFELSQEYKKNIAMGAAFGAVLTPFVWGVKSLAKTELPKQWDILNKKAVKKIREKYGEIPDQSVPEQLSLFAKDPNVSRDIYRAANAANYSTLTGKKLSKTSKVSAPTGNPALDGPAKMAVETGMIDNPTLKTNYASPSNSAARLAVDRAEASGAQEVIAVVDDTFKIDYSPWGFPVLTLKNPVNMIKAWKDGIGKIVPKDVRSMNFLHRYFLSPSEYGVLARELMGSVRHMKASGDGAFKAGQGEAIDMYRRAGFFRGRVEIFKQRFKKKNLSRVEHALQAGNQYRTIIPDEELVREFHLKPKEVKLYKELTGSWADKMWNISNDILVAGNTRAGKKVLNPQVFKFEGNYERIAKDLTPANIKNMSDDELAKMPWVARLIEDETKRGLALPAQTAEQIFKGGTGVKEAVIKKLREGERVVMPIDLGAGLPSEFNGGYLVVAKSSDLINPKILLDRYPGYFPVNHEGAKHMVVATNMNMLKKQQEGVILKESPVKFLFGDKSVLNAKNFQKGYKAKPGEQINIISVAEGNPSVSVSHALPDLLAEVKMRGGDVENIVQKFGKIMKLTDEQMDSLREAYIAPFNVPSLKHRGAMPLKGTGGRWKHKKNKDGTWSRKWDKDAASISSSLRAWEIRIAQMTAEAGSSSYRTLIRDAYTKEFGHLLEAGIGREATYLGRIKTLKELDLPATDANRYNIKQAHALQEILERQFNIPTGDQVMYQRAFENLAWGFADRALEKGKPSIYWGMLSKAFEAVSAPRDVINHFKFTAGAQIYLGNVTAALQQMESVFRAMTVGMNPINPASWLYNPALVAKDAFQTMGYLVVPKALRPTKFLMIHNEMRRMGVFADLLGVTDFGSVQNKIVSKVFYATPAFGESVGRVFAVNAARREAVKAAKKGAKGIFDKRGELTDEGITPVYRRANDIYINMLAEDTARINRGVLSVPGQFVLNPMLKLGETFIWGNKFTAGEKLAMGGSMVALFGPAGVPFLEDSMRVIAKLGNDLDNYFETGVWVGSPGTLDTALLQREKIIIDYVVEVFGLEKELATKVKNTILDFAVGGALKLATDQRGRYSFYSRFLMGGILTDLYDKYQSNGILESIPVIGITNRTFQGTMEALDIMKNAYERNANKGVVQAFNNRPPGGSHGRSSR